MSLHSIHLLLIDPQKDFCSPKGSLFVPGADKDMERVSRMIVRLKDRLADIHVTLDQHPRFHISNPLYWKDSKGKHPTPFTMIHSSDMESGRWLTSVPLEHNWAMSYLKALEAGGRYPHIIWPEHCQIGSEGSNVDDNVLGALNEWCERIALVDFVSKGSNYRVEHFSAVKSEVPDPKDPTTLTNMRLIKALESADTILLGGEALSHCLMSTMEDIASCFSDPKYVQKIVLLTDACSPVPNPPGTTIFSDRVAQFMRNMSAKGMRTSTTTDFLL